ncbi:TPA: putative holin-like toxin [Streptococcus agalactiae]|nr:putative holin-like toxin [Streptococcus agalactiae]HEQ4398118.1 putative holin-like toxin [Streptococcus pyogenes]HEQ9304707.1 putative holin-like toxin [Streptococcus pyogenes]HER2430866.1 putative holin-like toxin [Streptococcus pyogenes]HER6734988.1 putative holin-like toxin [Streptococcus pyogenes]
MGNSSKSNRKEELDLSTFEVLTLMFIAGNFVIALVKLVLELVKSTKNNRLNFGELTVIF